MEIDSGKVRTGNSKVSRCHDSCRCSRSVELCIVVSFQCEEQSKQLSEYQEISETLMHKNEELQAAKDQAEENNQELQLSKDKAEHSVKILYVYP